MRAVAYLGLPLRAHAPYGWAMCAGAIDPRSAMPKYQQLAAWLREKITAGELAGRLPAEKQMAAEYGVSVFTVRRALDVLRAEGLVRTWLGSGSEAVPPDG